MDTHAKKQPDVPIENRSTCNIDDEKAMLCFDNCRRKVPIKHDPKMLFPVLNGNLGAKHYQTFNASFCNVVKNERSKVLSDDLLDIKMLHFQDSQDGAALRSIDTKTHFRHTC